jgi:hypothetical protein
MPSLDLSYDYKKVKDKLSSTKAYTELKSQYDSAQKKAGDSLEQSSDSVTSQIDSVKNEVKRYQKEIKNQFDNKVTNANRQVLNKIDNIDKSSPFPYDFTEDDLSSASFSSSSSDSLTNNNNHNLPVNSNNQITSFVNNSVTDDSIIRF